MSKLVLPVLGFMVAFVTLIGAITFAVSYGQTMDTYHPSAAQVAVWAGGSLGLSLLAVIFGSLAALKFSEAATARKG